MNPFDLRGPQFLLFYLLLGLFTLAVLVLWERFSSGPFKGVALPRDPYLIAGLRGGAPEIAHLAIFSLLVRGVIVPSEKYGVRLAVRPAAGGPPPALHRVERAVVEALANGAQATVRLQRDSKVVEAARPTLQALGDLGLLPSWADRLARMRGATVGAVFLLGVAGVKLALALQRGRSNVLFLLLLAGLCAWALAAWGRTPPRTREGARVLADLRSLFRAQRMRCPAVPPVGPTGDLVLTAAVAGVVGVPFGRAPAERPARSDSGGCATTVGCTSGGGSSGGSSCGGSCGGGCGGCGS